VSTPIPVPSYVDILMQTHLLHVPISDVTHPSD
jgi:hypothetical protein